MRLVQCRPRKKLLTRPAASVTWVTVPLVKTKVRLSAIPVLLDMSRMRAKLHASAMWSDAQLVLSAILISAKLVRPGLHFILMEAYAAAMLEIVLFVKWMTLMYAQSVALTMDWSPMEQLVCATQRIAPHASLPIATYVTLVILGSSYRETLLPVTVSWSSATSVMLTTPTYATSAHKVSY